MHESGRYCLIETTFLTTCAAAASHIEHGGPRQVEPDDIRSRMPEARIIEAARLRGATDISEPRACPLPSGSDESPTNAHPRPIDRWDQLRNLRIVIEEDMQPLQRLTNAPDLMQAVRGIFKDYRQLYEKGQALHCDIGLDSLGYCDKAGQIVGILGEFDSAPSVRGRASPTYGAIDLLVPNPPQHLYRHDLESLFYVIASIVAGFHDGQRIHNAPLWKWHQLDMGTLLTEKQAFFFKPVVTTTAHFAALRLWILTLVAMFQRGNTAQVDHAFLVEESMGRVVPVFDEETLGGHVTFDAFAACIGL
ncbi:hypothetical protein B0H15DRAFT_883023 [Mycena belliarum]|uniref:Fungal-type protein kinase domain-containing protein n=1 Tax=Mycena belliarum TaxID=1033014 RepID=A0AAD6U672_9AGAR|nr:hypothetical protein B0H15DRAFT_883023 [Mycena belliae]